MKGYLKYLVCFLILLSSPVFSGEVTDKEYPVRGQGLLIVTYYHDGEYDVVDCTAFNKEGKPIGGSRAIPEGGGVARIHIHVPDKYSGTELEVTCK